MANEDFSLEKLPLGDRVISISNASLTLIQKTIVPDVSKSRWIVKEVAPAAGLANGVYPIDRANTAAKNTETPYSGAVLHRDKDFLYQLSNGNIVRHESRNISKDVNVGHKIDVSYKNGIASVIISDRSQRGPYAQKADDFRAMSEPDLKRKYSSDLAVMSALKVQSSAREVAQNKLATEGARKHFLKKVNERIAKHLEDGKPVNIAAAINRRDDQLEH